MAKQGKSTETTKVHRIEATDDTPRKTKKNQPSTTKETEKKPAVKAATSHENIFTATGRYFKGAWEELKQVRWPNRKNTWEMTLAIILFTLAFLTFILLIDAGFNWAFEQILK